MAKAYGFPEFEFVVTEHPVASLTRDEVAKRAQEMTPRILQILGVVEQQ